MEKTAQTGHSYQSQMPPLPSKVGQSEDDIEKLDEKPAKWKDPSPSVDKKSSGANTGGGGEKTAEERLQLQQQESTRRDNVLMMRLATKEQEMQDLLNQLQELKQAQTPSAQQLQTMLIDPAVNLLFEKMKTELTETKDRLEQAQNDLSAWKFTPDSVTGKKLMAKCRTLIQENQELGKQLSQGRIAQLEAELALQKKYSEELKGSQDEMNEFVIQLDEEVEGMQATICVLQQQLKDEKQNTERLEEENKTLKTRLEEVLAQQQAQQQQLQQQQQQQQQTVINETENKRMTPTICSPKQTEMNEEVNDIHSTDSNVITKQSDHFSPPTTRSASHEEEEEEDEEEEEEEDEDVEVDEEGMDVDEKEYPIKIEPKVTVPEEQPAQIEAIVAAAAVVESHPPMKKVKVITRQSAENLKNIESANSSVPTHSMTTRASNSSFSITDLLSHGKDSKKGKSSEATPVAENEENGDSTDNGALNGEIDDSVI